MRPCRPWSEGDHRWNTAPVRNSGELSSHSCRPAQCQTAPCVAGAAFWPLQLRHPTSRASLTRPLRTNLCATSEKTADECKVHRCTCPCTASLPDLLSETFQVQGVR